MKRLCLLILIITTLQSPYALGQTRIVMEQTDGVYKIPCLINGARVKMVFDTGASSVCLSSSIAEYLWENDYISRNDFIGAGKSIVADGSIIDNLQLILDDIEIGGLHLYNVEAVVVDSQSAPLLLGLSAISKLGRVELNGDTLTIFNSNANATEEEIVDSYLAQAEKYLLEHRYYKAAEYFEKVYKMGWLSNYGKYQYVVCLLDCDKYESALMVCESISDYDFFFKADIDIFGVIGLTYACLEMYDEAIIFYKKSFDCQIPSNSYEKRAYSASRIASFYSAMNWDEEAVKYYQMALACYELEWGLCLGYLFDDCTGQLGTKEKSYRNATIDKYAFEMVLSLMEAGSWSIDSVGSTIRYMARNGNMSAIKFCNKRNLPYNF